jgi:hypothetical protein
VISLYASPRSLLPEDKKAKTLDGVTESLR